MSKVLVTGASGFIGSRLIEWMSSREVAMTGLIRPQRMADAAVRFAAMANLRLVSGDLSDPPSLRVACQGVETVFHLAGHAQAGGADEARSAALHQRVTVDGTRALLDAAVRAGARRFVFASSVKAMGEDTGPDCLDESSTPVPVSAYGRAKLEAEELVLKAGKESGLHVCILRLAMVIGSGNTGSLPRMIEAVDKRRFPPLPELNNRRSLVHVGDVVTALQLAAEKPQANGKTFIVTDGKSYSTREIYTSLCQALGKDVPGWTVPVGVLVALAKFGDAMGRLGGRRFILDSETLAKLTGSACYRSDSLTRTLGFRPARNLQNSLPEMVAAYRSG